MYVELMRTYYIIGNFQLMSSQHLPYFAVSLLFGKIIQYQNFSTLMHLHSNSSLEQISSISIFLLKISSFRYQITTSFSLFPSFQNSTPFNKGAKPAVRLAHFPVYKRINTITLHYKEPAPRNNPLIPSLSPFAINPFHHTSYLDPSKTIRFQSIKLIKYRIELSATILISARQKNIIMK